MKKVICSNCEKTIQEGDNPPEYKMCIDCVRKTTPGADLNKIVDANGKTFESQTRKQHEMKLNVTTEILTQEYPNRPKPVVLLLFKILDYYKTPLFEFGCDFDKVTEWYEYMKKIDEEGADIEEHK